MQNGAAELLVLHDELDRLSNEKDSVAVTVILVFTAYLLFILGFDAGALLLMLGALVPAGAAVYLARADFRRLRRKRELNRLIAVQTAGNAVAGVRGGTELNA